MHGDVNEAAPLCNSSWDMNLHWTACLVFALLAGKYRWFI